jgi:hypothetical protein
VFLIAAACCIVFATTSLIAVEDQQQPIFHPTCSWLELCLFACFAAAFLRLQRALAAEVSQRKKSISVAYCS